MDFSWIAELVQFLPLVELVIGDEFIFGRALPE